MNFAIVECLDRRSRDSIFSYCPHPHIPSSSSSSSSGFGQGKGGRKKQQVRGEKKEDAINRLGFVRPSVLRRRLTHFYDAQILFFFFFIRTRPSCSNRRLFLLCFGGTFLSTYFSSSFCHIHLCCQNSFFTYEKSERKKGLLFRYVRGGVSERLEAKKPLSSVRYHCPAADCGLRKGRGGLL